MHSFLQELFHLLSGVDFVFFSSLITVEVLMFRTLAVSLTPLPLTNISTIFRFTSGL